MDSSTASLLSTTPWFHVRAFISLFLKPCSFSGSAKSCWLWRGCHNIHAPSHRCQPGQGLLQPFQTFLPFPAFRKGTLWEHMRNRDELSQYLAALLDTRLWTLGKGLNLRMEPMPLFLQDRAQFPFPPVSRPKMQPHFIIRIFHRKQELQSSDNTGGSPGNM